MADAARAERIRRLREGRGLSQWDVVSGLQDLAGKQVISPRGYQDWEYGKGISPGRAKLLAQFYGVEIDWLLRGEEEPDALANSNGLHAQLGRIEALLEANARELAEIREALRNR